MTRPAMSLGAATVLAAVFLGWSCQKSSRSGSAVIEPAEAAQVLAPTAGLPWFDDVTASAGIDFHHFDSSTPINYIQETMGSGLAWIDYNNDGWPDLFCVQAGPLRPAETAGPLPTNKLYRNNGNCTFTDVTERLGVGPRGLRHGCASATSDNDGFDDLLVLYLGESRAFITKRTDAAAGIRRCHPESRATRSALGHQLRLGGIDRDGYLDLYICNYVRWTSITTDLRGAST